MGRSVRGGVMLLAALLALAPALARADDKVPAAVGVAVAVKGQVLVSDVVIAPVAELAPSVVLALRRVSRPVVVGSEGFWRFHFLAFLTAPVPPDGALQVVASDVTDRAHPRPVRVFELAAEPGAVELRVNDFVVGTALGFERGHDYELAIAFGQGPLPTGQTQKPDVRARGVVTLR